MATVRPNQPPASSTSPSDPQRWVDQHGDALYGFAVSRLGDRALAEEAVQETFLAALRARDDFLGASSERTWLIGILKRKIVDQIRNTRRRLPTTRLPEADPAAGELFERGYWKTRPAAWPRDPETWIERNDFWEALERCLARLPTRMRDAFCLRELDDLSTAKICTILGVSTDNLCTIMYRARVRLRVCLDATWFGGNRSGGR